MQYENERPQEVAAMKLAVKLLLFLFVALCLVGSASAADIWVSTPVTATTINSAIATASASDVVIIPDGEYASLGQIVIGATVDGTEANPITLRAETPGGVNFTGNSASPLIFVQGDWWVIRDFKFIDLSEVGDVHTYGIYTRDATGTRITNNYFEGLGVLTNTDKNSWCVWLGNGGTGNYSRVDHNTFIENEAKCISLSYEALHCQIDHNYFKDTLQDGSNGFEGLHVGSGGIYDSIDLYTTVEYNLFENMSADPETISNKASNNTYRYNVFKSTPGKECYGLVLRGGSNCIVDGNYFFDVGSHNIRVHETGHKIINNYFENPGYSAILLAEGSVDYADVSNILIANNIIVNPALRGIYIGWWSVSGTEPENLTFKNNIITSNVSGSYLVKDSGHIGTFVWTTNLHYATGGASYWQNDGGGDEPGSGITHANPNLTTGYSIQRLQASSTNAIEQGTPIASVTDDIDGQVRDASNPDIGCDEYNTSAPLRLPVTVDDVGYDWSVDTPTTSDFTYYKIITLNQSMINQSIGTGTYPLLISTTDTDLRDNVQTGDDIVFFDADNTSLLPYEQELWNSTTGELVEWVGLEDATNVSYIVMYYGNATIANSENASGVWDSNYMMVQHFQETDIDGGAGDIKDSTSNDNDGTTHNMTTANLDTGLINGCFNFSVSNEARVNVSDDSTLDGFTSGFTISGLFNFNQEGAYYLVNKYDAGGDQRAWLLKLQGDDNLRIYVDDAGTLAEISNFNPTIVPGTDYKIDAVWESGEYPLLYFDGALANEVDHDGLVSSIKDSSSILRIGGGYSPGNTYFTGDEIRVSNIARSHAYIETDYNNTAYPALFISIGSEQGGGTPDTKFEYWDGAAWQENPADYHLWFECFWNTSGYPDGVCSNAEQSGSQYSLRITNNGSAAGTSNIKFNESSPAEVTVYIDDDYTVAGATIITNAYQEIGPELQPGENVTLSSWAKLEDLTSTWEYIVYVEVQ